MLPVKFKINTFAECFFGNSRESSRVFYKLFDIVKFDNIVKLSTCVLAHKKFNKSCNIPSLFLDSLRTAYPSMTLDMTNLKRLSTSSFKKRNKNHLLKCQS